MKRTVLYLAILLILGFGVYYFIFKPAGNDTPYAQNEAGFTTKDTGAIGKIFLVSPDGESVTLERTDSAWMVDKKYRAMHSTLDLLLNTLAQQAALYPVTKAAYDNVIRAMSTDAIKVELYGKDGKKMKVFYVGGAAVNNAGTNMLMEGARTPYVVQIGSFNGALTPRYTTHMRDWRDRTVFNIPAEEIKSVSVKYADHPLNSFEITRDKDSVLISADPAIEKMDKPNTRRARLYLKYFADINCEGYLNGLSDNDETIRTAPKQSTIDVTGVHGQHQHVDVYWMPLNRRSKNRLETNAFVPDDYDADRLYAVMNNFRDTVMIQQFAFRNIFHNASEFFQPDGTPVRDIIPQPYTKNVMMHKNQ